MLDFHGIHGPKCRYLPLNSSTLQMLDTNGVQEASSSNLDTRTKRGLLSNPLFILSKYYEYNLVLFFENLVLSFENNA